MKTLKTITGKEFSFKTEDKDNISVLCPGYVITPDGEFVDIKDNEDHSSVFTDYLKEYLEEPNQTYLDIIRGIRLLTELNHIVYLGVRPEDVNRFLNAQPTDMGYIILPDDSEKITPEQAQSCLNLIETNKSKFGNYNIINISFHFKESLCTDTTDCLDYDSIVTKLSERAQQGSMQR